MGMNIRVGKNRTAAMCILLLPVNHSFNFQFLCLTPNVWEVSRATDNRIKKRQGGCSAYDWQSFGIIFCWQYSSPLQCSMICPAGYNITTKLEQTLCLSVFLLRKPCTDIGKHVSESAYASIYFKAFFSRKVSTQKVIWNHRSQDIPQNQACISIPQLEKHKRGKQGK